MDIEHFQVSEAIIYTSLFDESEEGLFEVTTGHTKVGEIRKQVLGHHNLYVLKDSKSGCVLY